MRLSDATLFLIFFSPFMLTILTLMVLPILHFLMPKAVLNQYWKTPHFKPAELALLTNTLFAPMRTVMLMGAIAFPSLGKTRGISGAALLVPRWYRIAARVHVLTLLLCAGAIALAIVGGTFYA